MTPTEREQFDLEIYFETKKTEYRGCYEDAADYLRLPDASKISKIFNPNDSRANNVFGESVDILEALNHKHPKLARVIWEKVNVAVNAFMNGESCHSPDIALIVDATIREQLDVNFFVSAGKSQTELETEAFQALEQSKRQYEAIKGLRKVEIQEQNFGDLEV